MLLNEFWKRGLAVFLFAAAVAFMGSPADASADYRAGRNYYYSRNHQPYYNYSGYNYAFGSPAYLPRYERLNTYYGSNFSFTPPPIDYSYERNIRYAGRNIEIRPPEPIEIFAPDDQYYGTNFEFTSNRRARSEAGSNYTF